VISEIPQWGTKFEWFEANQSIDYHVKCHKIDFTRTIELALQMQKQFESIFPVQDELCSLTCRHCPSPCCIVATVWIDFRDLLFLHFSGQAIPRLQLIKKQSDVCRYSSPRGCLLPRLSRPFICTLYLCPPQMTNLRRMSSEIRDNYYSGIKIIKKNRRELENFFVDVVG
jgi:hypothetical protein